VTCHISWGEMGHIWGDGYQMQSMVSIAEKCTSFNAPENFHVFFVCLFLKKRGRPTI
jgi:hypothetical protein